MNDHLCPMCGRDYPYGDPRSVTHQPCFDCCEYYSARRKKDCYVVVEPSTTPWRRIVGQRLIAFPADSLWRIYSLHAGPEYGMLVWIGEP